MAEKDLSLVTNSGSRLMGMMAGVGFGDTVVYQQCTRPGEITYILGQIKEHGNLDCLNSSKEVLQVFQDSDTAGAGLIRFLTTSAANLPFDPEHADICICEWDEDIPEKKASGLIEVFRILKKGGRICIADSFSIKNIDNDLNTCPYPNTERCHTIAHDFYYDIMRSIGFEDIRFRFNQKLSSERNPDMQSNTDDELSITVLASKTGIVQLNNYNFPDL